MSTIIADVRVQGFPIVIAWVAQLSTNLWGESFHRCDVITSVGDDVLLFECTLLHNYLDEHLVFVTLKKIIILFLLLFRRIFVYVDQQPVTTTDK